MSRESLRAWKQITREQLEAARLTIDAKHRPSLEAMNAVGAALAWSFRNDRGYVDLTLEQLSENEKGIYSVETCKWAVIAHDRGRIWVNVERGGRERGGTRRVMPTFDPKGLAAHAITVGVSHRDDDLSEWEEQGITVGKEPENSESRWANPTALSRELRTTTTPPPAAVVVGTNDEAPRESWNQRPLDANDEAVKRLHRRALCSLEKQQNRGDVERVRTWCQYVATWTADHSENVQLDLVLAAYAENPRGGTRPERKHVVQELAAARGLIVSTPTTESETE